MNYKNKPIIKRLDGTFEIVHNGFPYQVCTKEIDPDGIYDIAEVAAFWGSLPAYDPNKRVEMPPMLFELKEQKLAEISEVYDQYDATGVTMVSLGFLIQIGQDHCVKLDGAIRFAELVGQTEIYITDANNVTHYGLTLEQAKQVLTEQMMASLAAHAKKQQLRAAVEAAETDEELNAVVIEF